MPSCSDGTHSCCFQTKFHVPSFSPFSAERKFRFDMKTCPSVGLEPLWGKNDKDLLLAGSSLHFGRRLVQLRGTVFSKSSHHRLLSMRCSTES